MLKFGRINFDFGDRLCSFSPYFAQSFSLRLHLCPVTYRISLKKCIAHLKFIIYIKKFTILLMLQEEKQHCWGDRQYIPNIDSYNPETFESEMFKFMKNETLSKVDVNGLQKAMETDIGFVRSVEQTCWRNFGLCRNQSQLTDQECEQIHIVAQQVAKKSQMSELDLLCDDLIEQQYLTYDNTLFFFFMKILFINAIIMTLGYALPALYHYGKGTRYLNQKLFNCSSTYCQFIDRFSMYNEESAISTFKLLEYLGLGMIAVLQIIFYLTWKYNKEIREIIRYEERCFERTLLIKGLPEGKYSQGDIIRLLEHKLGSNKQDNEQNNTQCPQIKLMTFRKGAKRNLFKSTSNIESQTSKAIIEQNFQGKGSSFNIKAIQVFYDLRRAKKMIQQITNACKQIWEITVRQSFEGRFATFVLEEQKYKTKKNEIIRLYDKLHKWRKRFLEDASKRRKYSLGSTLIHFENREDRDKLLKQLQNFYQLQWINSWGSYEPSIKLSQNQNQHQSIRLKDYDLKVGLAPEPENIRWQNVQHTYEQWLNNHSKCRIAMILVPLVHVAIIIGLQILKLTLGQTKSTLNSILSVLVTIAIVAVNQLLWVFLELAVRGQELRLLTSYQVYMNYAGFASTTLSIILAPLVVQYAWRGQYFGSLAVVGIAIDYQMSTVITLPILFIISPAELIMKIIFYWRKARNYLIRSKFEAEEGQRFKAIFELYDRSQFDVSVSYAFLMANFLHVTFFCMAAPILIPIFALQIFLFYWVCKIRMLKFCRFPKLIRRWLMGIVFANLLVSPLFFAAGCLVSQHAYRQHVVALDHLPLGTYLLFALWALFSLVSLTVDKLLENTRIFVCEKHEDNFTNLKDLQASRNKEYPSRSTSYFVGSNVLSLLGFQKAIMGTTRNRKAEELYEIFCEEQVTGDYAAHINVLNEIQNNIK